MVVPALKPVTVPDVLTVPTAVLVLLQLPPAVASLSEVVAPPAQTIAVPEMLAGVTAAVFTVTTTETALLPQELDSV